MIRNMRYIKAVTFGIGISLLGSFNVSADALNDDYKGYTMNDNESVGQDIPYVEYDFITKEEYFGVFPSSSGDNETTSRSEGFEGIPYMNEESTSSTELSVTRGGSWSVKDGNKYYYLSNGKMCTDKFVMIDGKYYSFDESGKLCTGIVDISDMDKAYFSKKNGQYVNTARKMKVISESEQGILCEDLSGKLYEINLNDKELVDSEQNKISLSKIEKGSIIHVIYKGSVEDATSSNFNNAYKIRLVK